MVSGINSQYQLTFAGLSIEEPLGLEREVPGTHKMRETLSLISLEFW